MTNRNSFSLFFILSFLFSISSYSQECSPNLKEIYSFPVGSVFQYKSESWDEAGSYTIRVERYTVTDKWWQGDILYYEREGSWKSENGQHNTYFPEYDSGLINNLVFVIDSTNHFLNACDSQLMYIHDIGYNPYNPAYSFVLTEGDKKIFGGANNYYTYSEDSLLIKKEIDYYTDTYRYIYKEGIGLWSKSNGSIWGNSSKWCQGYIINGDTVGKITGPLIETIIVPLSSPTASVKNEKKTFIDVYPNVIYGDASVYISSPKPYQDLQLLSLDGQEQSFIKLTSNKIRLGTLPRGIYLLRILFDDEIVVKRLIKY